jgi:hypothetical protein
MKKNLIDKPISNKWLSVWMASLTARLGPIVSYPSIPATDRIPSILIGIFIFLSLGLGLGMFIVAVINSQSWSRNGKILAAWSAGFVYFWIFVVIYFILKGISGGRL